MTTDLNAIHEARATVGIEDPGMWQPGVVTLTDFMRVPWSEAIVIGITGDVLVAATDRLLGFSTDGGGHANWLALVRGPSGTIHAVPGCRVQTITFDADVKSREYVAVP